MATDLAPLMRNVRLALELVDPVTGLTVWQGVQVEARTGTDKASGIEPVVSRSGRFVWLERDLPPRPDIARIACNPGRLPFAPEVIDLSGLPQNQKLVSKRLRPSLAYSMPPGVTAIRGRLFESRNGRRQGIANAVIQIAWAFSRQTEWAPQFPAAISHLRPDYAITDKEGDFLAFSRPAVRSTLVTQDSKDGIAKVRLQITRLDRNERRMTPPDFKFLDTLPAGSVAEGQLLPRDLALDWNTLSN